MCRFLPNAMSLAFERKSGEPSCFAAVRLAGAESLRAVPPLHHHVRSQAASEFNVPAQRTAGTQRGEGGGMHGQSAHRLSLCTNAAHCMTLRFSNSAPLSRQAVGLGPFPIPPPHVFPPTQPVDMDLAPGFTTLASWVGAGHAPQHVFGHARRGKGHRKGVYKVGRVATQNLSPFIPRRGSVGRRGHAPSSRGDASLAEAALRWG